MIHVQIASQLTAQGVSGVRWVLVEPVDPPLAAEQAPAAALADPAAAVDPATEADRVGSATAGALRLGALKLLVVALGLAAALWTAHVQVGPPGAPSLAPAQPGAPATPAHSSSPRPGLHPVTPPTVPPAAAPQTGDTPAPAASAPLPRLTAAL